MGDSMAWELRRQTDVRQTSDSGARQRQIWQGTSADKYREIYGSIITHNYFNVSLPDLRLAISSVIRMCELLPFALLLVLATSTIDVGTFAEITTSNSAHSTSLLCSFNRNDPITAADVGLCLCEWNGRTDVHAL